MKEWGQWITQPADYLVNCMREIRRQNHSITKKKEEEEEEGEKKNGRLTRRQFSASGDGRDKAASLNRRRPRAHCERLTAMIVTTKKQWRRLALGVRKLSSFQQAHLYP